MKKKVLILGGYGNFGKRIAKALVRSKIHIVISGRNKNKAADLKKQLDQKFVSIECFDVHKELDKKLKKIKPTVVINTCGPFQGKNYDIAQTCIKNKVHYIDLADAREFVCGISELNAQAKKQKVTVISGASTVPALSSAVLDNFKSEFSNIKSVTYGISPGQKTEIGLATLKAILSYVGKPISTLIDGKNRVVYGWQDIYLQEYPEIGTRWMANCEIPDLDLLPKYYKINSIKFSAGLDLGFLHLILWAFSYIVRVGLINNIQPLAPVLLKIKECCNFFGTKDGAMHIIISGENKKGQKHTRKWFIIARNNHGPEIPTIPAIILAKKLIQSKQIPSGAKPCLNMISLKEYTRELIGFDIKVYTA